MLSSNCLMVSQGPSPTPTRTIDNGYSLQTGIHHSLENKAEEINKRNEEMVFILPCSNNGVNGLLLLWTDCPMLCIDTSCHLTQSKAPTVTIQVSENAHNRTHNTVPIYAQESARQ